MPGPLVLVGPALATAGRYIVKNGAKKGIEKYGPKVFKQIQKDKGLKTVGDKVIKKRMTAAERKAMSKDFNKSLADAQKAKKGPTNKEFMARVDKDMAKQKRIDKVKAENMAAAKRKPLYGGGSSTKKSMRMSYKTGGEVMPKAKPC